MSSEGTKQEKKKKEKEKKLRKVKKGKGPFLAQKRAIRRVSLRRREREKGESRERNLSLRSTEIGLWVFVGTRGKVGPRVGTKI